MAKVTVTPNTYSVDTLYQYDLNQVLEIHGLSFNTAPEIHFAHVGMSHAIVRKSTMDEAGVVRAQIPNSLLQKAQRIKAYICVYEGDTFQTVYKIAIPVKPRSRPADYDLPDEYELYSFDTMEAEAVTLGPGEDATVEKVQRGDGTVVLRFGLPTTPTVEEVQEGVIAATLEAVRASADAAAMSEENAGASAIASANSANSAGKAKTSAETAATNAGNSASAAQQAKQAAEQARDDAKRFAESLPTVTAADNGKVLGVVDGVIGLVTPKYPIITQNGTILTIE